MHVHLHGAGFRPRLYFLALAYFSNVTSFSFLLIMMIPALFLLWFPHISFSTVNFRSCFSSSVLFFKHNHILQPRVRKDIRGEKLKGVGEKKRQFLFLGDSFCFWGNAGNLLTSSHENRWRSDNLFTVRAWCVACASKRKGKKLKEGREKERGKRYLHLFVFSHDHSIIDKIHESYRAEGRRGAAGLWDSAVYWPHSRLRGESQFSRHQQCLLRFPCLPNKLFNIV